MFRTFHRKGPFASYVLTAALLFFVPHFLQPSHAVTFRSVVLSDQQAPGLDPGIMLNPTVYPTINRFGEVAFRGILSGSGVNATNGEGVWVQRNGTIELVARAGDQIPGAAPGVVYDSITATSRTINNSGGISFISTVTGNGVDDTNDSIYVAGDSTSLDLVTRTGNQAPGTDPGIVFSHFNNRFNVAVFNDVGSSVLRANLTGPGIDATNDAGIWSDTSGTLSLIARTGNQAQGTDPGINFASIENVPVLNNTGQTAFQASLIGSGVDATNNEGLWMGATDNVQLVVRASDPAPGLGPGVAFGDSFLTTSLSTFNPPTINNAGHMAFTGGLTGTGITDANSQGLWVGTPNALQLVVQAGDPAPGTDDVFLLIRQPVMNDNGHVAFQAVIPASAVGLGGGFARGIWTNRSGNIESVVLQGDQAPGVESGSVFADFNGNDSPEINKSGQIAFRASLSSPNPDIHFRDGIWATSPDGTLQLIARAGDEFDANDDPLIDDLRTISFIDMLFTGHGGGVNGQPIAFNDNGELAFYVNFTDGTSGIFVASTRLPGDLNGDGFVGIDDLNAVLTNWNQSVTPGDFLAGDTNNDGFVGIDDLNAVLGNWNAGTPPESTAAIPEPGTMMLLMAGVSWRLCRVNKRLN